MLFVFFYPPHRFELVPTPKTHFEWIRNTFPSIYKRASVGNLSPPTLFKYGDHFFCNNLQPSNHLTLDMLVTGCPIQWTHTTGWCYPINIFFHVSLILSTVETEEDDKGGHVTRTAAMRFITKSLSQTFGLRNCYQDLSAVMKMILTLYGPVLLSGNIHL
jgi:hypothetical protein